MNQHAHIIERLGRDAIAARLGVTPGAVDKARLGRGFPASWYLEVRAMCFAADLDCPPSLFNFKRAAEFQGTCISEGQR